MFLEQPGLSVQQYHHILILLSFGTVKTAGVVPIGYEKRYFWSRSSE